MPQSLTPRQLLKKLQVLGFEIDHSTGSHYVGRTWRNNLLLVNNLIFFLFWLLGFLPGGKVAAGPAGATIKNSAFFGAAFHYFARLR